MNVAGRQRERRLIVRFRPVWANFAVGCSPISLLLISHYGRGNSKVRLLLHIDAETLFYVTETAPNNSYRHVVIFGLPWANVALIWKTAFPWTIFYVKYSWHVFITYLRQLYFKVLPPLLDKCSVWQHRGLYGRKVGKSRLYHLSRWSRIGITLIRPSLDLNNIFSIKNEWEIYTPKCVASVVFKNTVAALEPLWFQN